MNESWSTSSKQHRTDRFQKATNKKRELTQFLTEAAQTEDTSLQISDIKNSSRCEEADHKPPENPRHKRRVRRTIEEDEEEAKGAGDSISSDDEFFCQAVRHLKQVKKIKTDGEDRTVSVRIEDVNVRAEPDSGAQVTVMSEHQFKALTNRSNVKPTLQPSRVKLSTL